MEEIDTKIIVGKHARVVKTGNGIKYFTTFSIDKTDFAGLRLLHSFRTKSATASDIDVFKGLEEIDNDDFYVQEYNFDGYDFLFTRMATEEEIEKYECNENSHLQNTEPPKPLINRIGKVLVGLLAIAALTVLIWNLVYSIINLFN